MKINNLLLLYKYEVHEQYLLDGMLISSSKYWAPGLKTMGNAAIRCMRKHTSAVIRKGPWLIVFTMLDSAASP